MSKAPSLFQRFSYVYKTSRFPWKKHVLIGHDLSGNEYWQAPNPNQPNGRPKRWVKMLEKQRESDFTQDKLPVQWQAWLRHTRPTTPTIQEIIAADQRRLMIQERARQLDEEWARRKLELEEQEALLIEGNRPPAPKREQQDFVPGSWSPEARER
ncbi:hypothetical protein K450DRAFT_220579 [Umbelopsis ramanniana AG]|uniref:NADH dehydrogenase [ubiquinone] 1 alpha subcomplex subunit 12 n=1 Tax=Umbelopsis ramanniana AG TaxID=1314678 RepID=A0AAD5EJA3_UMBRA|nr:uncharacterized protein K450DRAFT_220579 [Umbelopsis ramanniana AG]KAI8583916.1 hypothetical protein K450DRAFT_220579 [Umbelopsis ramanniana AG]